jgi:hypothetical protein
MAKVYNNQKVLTFNPSLKDALHPYTLWNNDDLHEAITTLSPTTFQVYIYLGQYKEMKTEFALSRAHLMKELSIAEGTYRKAIKELQEKGYLIPNNAVDCPPNSYIFSEGKVSVPQNLR